MDNNENLIAKEMEQFTELIQKLDVASFEPMDQLYIVMAYMELIQKTKPIIAKYAASDATIRNFIMKL